MNLVWTWTRTNTEIPLIFPLTMIGIQFILICNVLTWITALKNNSYIKYLCLSPVQRDKDRKHSYYIVNIRFHCSDFIGLNNEISVFFDGMRCSFRFCRRWFIFWLFGVGDHHLMVTAKYSPFSVYSKTNMVYKTKSYFFTWRCKLQL